MADLFHISSFAKFSSNTFNIKYEFQRAYESLRLVCGADEKDELGLIDGRYIFGFSTAIGLALITLYALTVMFVTPNMLPCKNLLFDEQSMLCRNHPQGYLVILALTITSAVLAVGSYFENKRSRLIVICKLIEKYKDLDKLDIDLPSTCKIRFRKLEEKIQKTAYTIIKDFLYQRKITKEKTILDRKALIDLLDHDDTFQGNRENAEEIIDQFINSKVLDLSNGYLYPDKFKDTRRHQSHHVIWRTLRSFKLRMSGQKIEISRKK